MTPITQSHLDDMRQKAEAARERCTWVTFKPSGLVIQTNDTPTPEGQIALLDHIAELKAKSSAQSAVTDAMVEAALAAWYPGEWPHDGCFKGVNADGTTFADTCRRDMRKTLEAALAAREATP